MTLSSLDFWRLADELSVIDATILIVGGDPSSRTQRYDETGYAIRDDIGRYVMDQRIDYEGFEPVFKAIRSAILSNKLPAKVAFAAAVGPDFEASFPGPRDAYFPETIEIHAGIEKIPLDTVVRMQSNGLSILSLSPSENMKGSGAIYIFKQPSWAQTTVEVSDLKRWLSLKGLAPEFFFPTGKPEGFRDQNHPRYSPKLACAVAAWEAVKKPKPNSSVKATIEQWVRSNAARFGMVGDDGNPAKKAVEEVAVVANWATSGGAVPTSIGVRADEDDGIEKIENYSAFRPGNPNDIPF